MTSRLGALVAVATAVFLAGCGHTTASRPPGQPAQGGQDKNISLVAAARSLIADPTSGLMALARGDDGGLVVVPHLTDTGSGSGKLVVTSKSRGGLDTATTFANSLLWSGVDDAVLSIDPGSGSVVREYAPPPGDGKGDSALDGDWISGIAVRADELFVARNNSMTLTVIGVTSGGFRSMQLPPGAAGAQTLAVDDRGYVYLGSAEKTPDRVVILDSQGNLVATIAAKASRLWTDATGAVWIPSGSSCTAYREGTSLRTVEMGALNPTACQSVNDVVLGWNIDSGRYSVVVGKAMPSQVDPTVLPTTVVGPMGGRVDTVIRQLPVDLALLASGEVAELVLGGREVVIHQLP